MDIEDCNGRSYMSGMPSVCSFQVDTGADVGEGRQPLVLAHAPSQLSVSLCCHSAW